MKNKTLLVTILFLFALAAPGSSFAAKGFYIGGGIGYDSLSQDGDFTYSLDPQPGLYLEPIQLGYNFTNRVGMNVTWGMAQGTVTGDSLGLGENATWLQHDVMVSGRYSFDFYSPVVPYVEAGYGIFLFEAKGDAGRFVADQMNGYRAAAGVNFYAGDFFVAPEVSWLSVEYDGGKWYPPDTYSGGLETEFDAQSDMLVFAIKMGIHFRR